MDKENKDPEEYSNKPLDGDNGGDDVVHDIIPVSGMYENWFLEYASYVILERAVPAIEDGLKPVQRRILHSMKEMDDGRFNKVANVIGQTMQYHPHGDASIGDAMVNLGQKDLLIETQGNWGDIRTGDSAAAARYIEARLSKFALDVVFNPETTEWQLSYDGRKKEPVTLPVKFPLLLAQGVEGIAVGLSTKVLPHNFCELIQASIDILKKKRIAVFPDFPTGGMIDVTNYNDGQRGGKVRIRAKIEELDKKTLVIKEIPFGTTTTSLIDSIIKANDNGKIKIKKVIDNTAKDVEIQIQLVPGVSSDITIDALYAFTDCEISISPNACVIVEDKPHFLSVTDILKISTEKTVELLNQELEIKRLDLKEKLLFASLEKIFILEEMYIDFKYYTDKPTLLQYLDERFAPHKKDFYRQILPEDYERLTQIPMIRITRFDSFKADELMKKLQEELKETEFNLANLTDFAIRYFTNLLKKYGAGRERKTEIRTFDIISANVVAAANAKLYINRQEGFIGTGLKKDEFVTECSDIDDIIVFRKDGKCVIKKIGEKIFVGKDIIFAGVFKKGDERMVYNMIYLDGESGVSFVKRFQVLGVTREKEYELTKGTKGSKVLYFSANPNGEAETVTVTLTPTSAARNKIFDFDFSEIEIKGRNVLGNILTKYGVKKVAFKEAGSSTLGGLNIWYDSVVGRLNQEGRGKLLGNFEEEDRIIVFYTDGNYELKTYELTNRFDAPNIVHIEKFDADKIVSAVYMEGESKSYYAKRFKLETSTIDKKFNFISESEGSKLIVATTLEKPELHVEYTKGKYVTTPSETLLLDDFVEVKGWKAIGNKISPNKISKLKLILPEQDENTDESLMKENINNAQEELKLKDKTNKNSEKDKGFDVGSSVDLDPKKKKKGPDDQLNLF